MNDCGCGDPRCRVGERRFNSISEIKREFFPNLWRTEQREEQERLDAEPEELAHSTSEER